MDVIIKSLLPLTLLLFAVSVVQAQKKVQTFKVSQVINAPADKVWAIVGQDYGAVANSHPRIISSNYINGSLQAREGAERVCNFNDKGTQFLHERMVNYDPDNMTFVNQVFHAGKFPVDPDYTRALYKVEDLGNGQSRMTFDMQFRTKPAMMGALMKGNFRKLIEDYFISIEHHARTGEVVNKENFKQIKKQYKKQKVDQSSSDMEMAEAAE
ncbi:SRPBCC family protein [Pontibacter sp. G13]|uniref:SRPBCC family protein n=1 Tax=Pontibacter sp. G13 TaxID=3074898 RepID=UPI00288B075E|nr:SRPBCC family protein [Pontibacter sp. G13]WNJ17014.1 SRPBCC family protein [Pontibacter sp. G13]